MATGPKYETLVVRQHFKDPFNEGTTLGCSLFSHLTPGIRMAVLIAVSELLALGITSNQSAESLATVRLSGAAAPVISLTAGSAGSSGFASIIEGSETGATAQGSAANTPEAEANIDFGDLSRGSGRPVIAAIVLRVRANSKFAVTMSRFSFSATNLHYHGKDISGASDNGSFLTVSANQCIATGSGADPAQCHIASGLASGIAVSDLPGGAATRTAFVLAEGPPVSHAGGLLSQGNAVDIPVRVSCPTGTALGPVSQGQGSFQATLQFEIYSGT